jgi:hypothetical protein
MKFLKTMPIMLLAAMIMTSCGKNDSGGGSSSGGGVITSGTIGADGLPTTTGTNFTSIEQLRAHITSASMAVNAGTYIERFGQYGEEVSSSNASSTTLRQVIYYAGENSPNNQYGGTRTLNKSNAIYTEMLMNTANECDRVEIGQRTITIRDTNGSNQRNVVGVQATCVEVTTTTVLGVPVTTTRYRQSIIYSSAFPMAANPIAISNSDIQLNSLRRVGNAVIVNVQ